MKLFQSVLRPLGFDLGSSRTRVWVKGEGLVADLPTCIAVDERSQKVLAVGQDAVGLVGRAPDYVTIYHPVQKGIIEYPEVMVAFLRVVIQQTLQRSYFFRPVMMASVPAHADAFARQTVTDVLFQVGAREVYTISQPLAAAIGAGVPIADTSGSFILHLGGGIVEAAIISLGSQVASFSEFLAGEQLDKAIKTQVQNALSLEISLEEANSLKHNVATLLELSQSQLVVGQDIIAGVPKEITVSSEDVFPELARAADAYVELMKRVLEQVPPELTSDLIDKGLLMTGGMAQLQGLDQYLVNRLGVSVSVVEQSDVTVIKGVGRALDHLELFKSSLGFRV